MSLSKINLIAAIDPCRNIGLSGQLPWHVPEDLAHFKRTTMGHTCVMGRKTYESIGKPLEGRDCVVMSRTMDDVDGVTVCRSLEDVLWYIDGKEVFVVGGSEIYSQFMPIAEKIYLTMVHKDCKGDTQFPEMDDSWNGKVVKSIWTGPSEDVMVTFLEYERSLK